MHTLTQPIYILKTETGFKVKAHRGWVTSPTVKEFSDYASAYQYAMKKFRTKYYANSCVIDETQRS